MSRPMTDDRWAMIARQFCLCSPRLAAGSGVSRKTFPCRPLPPLLVLFIRKGTLAARRSQSAISSAV